MNAALSLTRDLLLNRRYFAHLSALLLVGEAVLLFLIIRFVAYTEIDWIAYIQQAQIFLKGERNYTLITGDTGPCVYPAGHLYIYSLLQKITEAWDGVRTAQYVFAFLYLATQAVVFRLYSLSESIPPFVLILLTLSKRLHSIYVLRLFNDGFAMFFLYASILAICKRWYTASAVLFSMALGIKMNILLFAPAFAFISLLATGLYRTMASLATITAIQVMLAQPFTLLYPREYLTSAFDFSRVFFYEWTVNWRFVSEETFLSPQFSSILQQGHIFTLAVCVLVWATYEGGPIALARRALRNPEKPASIAMGPLSADYIFTVFATCNLAGLCFARSLHYQFYSWEAHSLPFLTWMTAYPLPIKLVLLGMFEYAWNVYPSTPQSSMSLLVAHVALLGGVLFSMSTSKPAMEILVMKELDVKDTEVRRPSLGV